MYREFIISKRDFLAAAERTYVSGLQTGTGGNLSTRILGTDYMIVKPSGFTYGQCDENNLVITDFAGEVLEGTSKPTRECTLHGAIYARYPGIGGIVHTHSIYSILISQVMKELPLVTLHSELKLKRAIPVIDVKSQSVTKEELPKIWEVMDADPSLPAFILKGHGIVAMASNTVKAEQTAELIEETAHIAWELRGSRR